MRATLINVWKLLIAHSQRPTWRRVSSIILLTCMHNLHFALNAASNYWLVNKHNKYIYIYISETSKMYCCYGYHGGNQGEINVRHVRI